MTDSRAETKEIKIPDEFSWLKDTHPDDSLVEAFQRHFSPVPLIERKPETGSETEKLLNEAKLAHESIRWFSLDDSDDNGDETDTKFNPTQIALTPELEEQRKKCVTYSNQAKSLYQQVAEKEDGQCAYAYLKNLYDEIKSHNGIINYNETDAKKHKDYFEECIRRGDIRSMQELVNEVLESASYDIWDEEEDQNPRLPTMIKLEHAAWLARVFMHAKPLWDLDYLSRTTSGCLSHFFKHPVFAYHLSFVMPKGTTEVKKYYERRFKSLFEANRNSPLFKALALRYNDTLTQVDQHQVEAPKTRTAPSGLGLFTKQEEKEKEVSMTPNASQHHMLY